MKYSDAKLLITKTWEKSPELVFHLQSAPGTGKTSLCYDAAREYLIARGVPTSAVDDRILLFRPSLHDPVDLLGVPTVSDGKTTFAPPEMLHRFAQGTGPGVIIWDELPQASTMLANAIAGALLDKQIAEVRLDPLVAQISTGNRAEDRAGAQRLLTQVANRLCVINLDVSVDDVTRHFMAQGVDPLLIAFLRFRPALLMDFDPARAVNATPRSWERAARHIPADLPAITYIEALAGMVGDGPAREYVAFREIAQQLPSFEVCTTNPETAPLPTEPSAQFAVCAMLAHRGATSEKFPLAWRYIKRLPPTFHVVFMLDVINREPKLKFTPEFTDFALINAEVMA